MHKFQLLLATAVMLMTGTAMASGGFGGPSGGGFNNAPRQVDEAYEFGKSVYKGRAPGSEKITYCLKVDGEVKKLKRSTAKAYRKGSTQDFAQALIDCDAPDRLALTTMSREHVPLVLYYLNKRFNLDLVNNTPG